MPDQVHFRLKQVSEDRVGLANWFGRNGQPGRFRRQAAGDSSALRAIESSLTRGAFVCRAGRPTERASGPFDPDQFANAWTRERRLVCTVLVLFAVVLCSALAASATEEPFLARTYTNRAGATLRYRLLTPTNYEAGRRYPVILYLHGAAGRGSDNLKPLDWGPRLIADSLRSAKHECFLVVPQCPRSEGWSNITPGGRPTPEKSLQLALELLTNGLPKEFNLDSARRYLTGVSMGGHATWALLCQDTGLFAAAVPVCAGGDARRVTDSIARVPVWVFHSDDDHLVPVQQARDFVKAWRAHHGEVRYTEYTGVKHSSWTKAYVEPTMYDWLFEKKTP